MQTILDAARLLGWSCFHPYDSRRSFPGWPDIVCARIEGESARMLAIECKTERGRVSAWQRYWLDLLGQVPGVTAMVAKPSDWDAVERALRGGGS